jgi:hypothetical protein
MDAKDCSDMPTLLWTKSSTTENKNLSPRTTKIGKFPNSTMNLNSISFSTWNWSWGDLLPLYEPLVYKRNHPAHKILRIRWANSRHMPLLASVLSQSSPRTTNLTSSSTGSRRTHLAWPRCRGAFTESPRRRWRSKQSPRHCAPTLLPPRATFALGKHPRELLSVFSHGALPCHSSASPSAAGEPFPVAHFKANN